MKQLVRFCARKIGLDIRKSRSIPFGVDPYADIAASGGNVSVAFDVGANVGQTASKMLQAFPRARIFSFEPVPSTFAELQHNHAGNSRVATINSALGASVGAAEITDGPTSGQNTLNIAAKADAATVMVQVNTVDQFAAGAGLTHIDVLKIDTEGYESDVLAGAEGMLREGRIRYVLAECEFVRNTTQPHGDFFDIFERLSHRGFRLVAVYTGGIDGQGWVWGDVLFSLPNGDCGVRCSPFR